MPLWKKVITNGCGVPGSRQMCLALTQSGESIMVFPGGAREVFKGKTRIYQLRWKNRLGFVRMAVEHSYSITPFCSVGADELFDVVIDGEDIMNSAVGKPIDTTRYPGQAGDERVLRRVRGQTAQATEKLLADTLVQPAQSRGEISVWRKILQKT